MNQWSRHFNARPVASCSLTESEKRLKSLGVNDHPPALRVIHTTADIEGPRDPEAAKVERLWSALRASSPMSAEQLSATCGFTQISRMNLYRWLKVHGVSQGFRYVHTKDQRGSRRALQ